MGTLTLSLFRLGSLVIVAASLIGHPAKASGASSVEVAIKATYLAKFSSYLDWPSRHLPDGAPIIVCVIGRDPFGSSLQQAVAGIVSGGHPLVLRRYSSASDVGKCHMAYLGGSARDISAALSAAGSNPVVTVTDSRNANISGMIHFQLVGGSVKFDIDTRKASRTGVGISSRLLGLARKVHRADTK